MFDAATYEREKKRVHPVSRAIVKHHPHPHSSTRAEFCARSSQEINTPSGIASCLLQSRCTSGFRGTCDSLRQCILTVHVRMMLDCARHHRSGWKWGIHILLED